MTIKGRIENIAFIQDMIQRNKETVRLAKLKLLDIESEQEFLNSVIAKIKSVPENEWMPEDIAFFMVTEKRLKELDIEEILAKTDINCLS